ncbi:hypothetical protein CHU98_g6311 [Xylaria longipes]|nr:hypothetical protein CHU98_g6311 [Xylaria longipes]
MSNSRKNNATEASIERQIFASGTFKNVYSGQYTAGTRAGQACVAKEFKTGSVYEDHYFAQEMNIIRCTQKVIDDWHDARVIDKRILLNTPEIWEFEETGAKNLVEPMIENFEKFNSNTGWASITGGVWSEAMQALSHFSYHNSGGQLLLPQWNPFVLPSAPVWVILQKRVAEAQISEHTIASNEAGHVDGLSADTSKSQSSHSTAGVRFISTPVYDRKKR